MKNLRKYSLLLGMILLIPACAHAEIIVKDTISPEFIYNQGYSSEVSRLITEKTKDPATPIPTEEKSALEKWKCYFIKLVNPDWEAGYEFPSHDINYKNSGVEDL